MIEADAEGGTAPRSRRAAGLVSSLIALLVATPLHSLAGEAVPAADAAAAPQAKLVVVLVIDQLRRDRLVPELPGGLGRLAREGRVYGEAEVSHAVTETCPGHVTLLTGRYPGPAGVPGNSFIDRDTGEVRYCVEDRSPDARVIGGGAAPSKGRSPRNVRVTGLPKWLKQISPESRVMSVSGKDRAAIASLGHGADAAYWFQIPVGFSSSLYYMPELPDWVQRWNGSQPARNGFMRELPPLWRHEDASPGRAGRLDDYYAEAGSRSRTSGHPLRQGDDLEAIFQNVYRSPYLDDLSLDFALELADREALGRRGATDLLAVALSATDTVGHSYGPWSHEARDALTRLDRSVGRFLSALEERVGADRLLVVLTADHGVLPIPEWLQETGGSRCSLKGGRQGVKEPMGGLLWKLQTGIGPVISLPPDWFAFAGSSVHINRDVARERESSIEEIAQLSSDYLESFEAIEKVWTREEILTGQGEPAELQRRSFDAERSGDLRIQVAPDCLLHSGSRGTTHGSPHGYDREVPLVFMGAGVVSGVIPGPAATVDVAPTLARHLGLAVPDGLDGRVLPLTAPVSLSVEGETEQPLDDRAAQP